MVWRDHSPQCSSRINTRSKISIHSPLPLHNYSDKRYGPTARVQRPTDQQLFLRNISLKPFLWRGELCVSYHTFGGLVFWFSVTTDRLLQLLSLPWHAARESVSYTGTDTSDKHCTAWTVSTTHKIRKGFVSIKMLMIIQMSHSKRKRISRSCSYPT